MVTTNSFNCIHLQRLQILTLLLAVLELSVAQRRQDFSYIMDSDDHLLLIRWKTGTNGGRIVDDCWLYADRRVIRALLQGIATSQVTRVKDSNNWEKMCTLKMMNYPMLPMYTTGNTLSSQEKRARPAFILPGTKWCGAGTVAKSYDDLGREAELDKCCRSHDHCPESISGWQEKYGLRNSDIFTRSHCDCDAVLRDCLLNVKTSLADFVGGIYFNFLRIKCIRLAPPVSSCLSYESRGLVRSCQDYRVDDSQPHVWQFFDNSFYNTSRKQKS